MHAVSHSLAHRGPSASRTRARWQPYSSIPSSSTARSSPSSAYLNTPATTVSTPASVLSLPLCESEPLKQSLSIPPKDQLRDVQKVRYVNGLVDIAVKSLGEIWNPHDIPPVFSTPTCSTIPPALPITTHVPPTNGQTSTHVFTARYTQLPSPPVSPNHTVSPSPSPTSMPTPRPSCLLNSSAAPSRSNVTPMKAFVHEVLRRSRTSCSVLQTALCYLEAVRHKVPDIVRQEKEGSGIRGEVDQSSRIIQADDPTAGERIDEDINFDDFIDASRLGNADNHGTEVPMPTIRETSLATPGVSSWQPQDPPPLVASIPKKQPSREPLPALPPLPSPLLCPRRTFLASLILASKFMQDKCYSNRAWAKLAGLPAREIGRCERALGEALEWRLWVGKVPAQRPHLQRSRSDGDILSSDGRDAFLSAPGSTPGAAMAPPPGNNIRRCSTLPASAFQQHPPASDNGSDTFFPPAPIHPAGPSIPFAATMQGPWMPLPPPSPIAVDGDVAGIPLAEYSPTPTLSVSPTTTDASDGPCEERTIQMNTFIEMASPAKGLPDATYAYAVGMGSVGEEGIAGWGAAEWAVRVRY